ncbi:MAG TPA: glycosyltransferase, partial [Pirellulales bacterium]
MKLTAITHVWNEAFLLPYWLRHHYAMFDHGVVIDYGSTDGTPELARQLAPNWEVRRSRNELFDAGLADQEVMEVERELTGWKIALNVTEFLCHDDLRGFVRQVTRDRPGVRGVWAKDVVMVDRPQDADEPLSAAPLYFQKQFGYPGNGARSRLLHCFPDGRYEVGRHTSGVLAKRPDEALILAWFGWCPIKSVWQRKLAIQRMIPESDKRLGRSWQHTVSEETLRAMYEGEVAKSFDLTLGCPSYARMIDRLRLGTAPPANVPEPSTTVQNLGHEPTIVRPVAGAALDVSVVIPVCDGAPFIARTLRSVFNQSPPPREVIVVDDASTDDTRSAIRCVAATSAVAVRILETNRRSGGPAQPLNLGVREAVSSYIALLDHDDVMLPGKLARQIACMKVCPAAGLVMSRERVEGRVWGGERNPRASDAWNDLPRDAISDDCFRIASADAYEALIEHGCFWGSASGFVFPRPLLERSGPFDERFHLYADFAFVQKLARDRDIVFIDDVLFERHLRSEGHYRHADELRKTAEQLLLLWRFDRRRL